MRQLYDLADQHAWAARSQAARDFSAAAFYVMKSGEAGLGQAAEIASRRHPRVAEFLSKAAVSGGTTSSPGWAAEIADAGAAQCCVPGPAVRSGLASSTHAAEHAAPAHRPHQRARPDNCAPGRHGRRGHGKPLFVLSFMGALTERFKSTAMVVLSNELLNASPDQAISMIERELGRGVIAAFDRSFIGFLVDGIAPISTSGTTATAVLADIGDALADMQLHAARGCS